MATSPLYCVASIPLIKTAVSVNEELFGTDVVPFLSDTLLNSNYFSLFLSLFLVS